MQQPNFRRGRKLPEVWIPHLPDGQVKMGASTHEAKEIDY